MSKKRLAGVVGAAALLVASVALLTPLLTAGTHTYVIEMYEFGYRLREGELPLEARPGQQLKIKLVNTGGVVHELMIFSDKESVDPILSSWSEASQDLHHELEGVVLGEWRLEPGEEEVIELSFDKPGTYWAVCLETKGSSPLTHAHKGMVSPLVIVKG